MRPKAICYLIIMLLITGMIACGADDDDSEPTETDTSTPTSSEPAEPIVTAGRNVDFAAEEQAIRELYERYVTAHGDQETEILADVWLKSESDDVFTAWTFWAGTFERNNGWKAVTAAWDGIFRLHRGVMTTGITYIAIDRKGKAAVLRATYKWDGLQGDLISALEKDESDWKIRAIDYTGGKNGKQVKDLIEPAHTFGEIPED